MNPFNSILGDLAGPFIKAYDSTFGVIKSVKEAYAVLKNLKIDFIEGYIYMHIIHFFLIIKLVTKMKETAIVTEVKN
jgi:hypothetical protein